MNTSLTAYTPLETLLLFQLLKINGVDQHVFGTISDLLKTNRHVRDAKQYDGSRLSPDALRELFTKLVKDEAKTEALPTSPADPGTNGDHAGNSKKRKAPSPALPSFDDVTKNPNLIPKLVEKLYARYRAQVTAEIREEEQRYQRLQREVQEIEHGDWDHKFKKEIDANGLGQNTSSGAGPAAESQSRPKETLNATPGTHTLSSNTASARTPVTASASPHNRPSQPVIATPASQSNGKPSENIPGRVPQLGPMVSPVPASAKQVRHPSSQINTPNPLSLPPQNTPGALNSPSTIHQSPYPPSQPSVGFQAQQSRSSLSQTPLPPQSDKRFMQPSNPSPYPKGDVVHSQVSPSPAGRSSQIHPPGPPVPQHAHVPSTPTYQNAGQYAQSDSQQRPQYSQPPQYPQPGSIVPSKGGIMLPPFQVDLQRPVQTPQQPLKPNSIATPLGKVGTPKIPATVPAQLPSHSDASTDALLKRVVHLLGATPLRPGVARPQPFTATSTPSSETRWKRFPPRHGAATGPLRSPSVSPIRDLAPPTSFPIPGPRSTASRGRPRGQTKNKDVTVSDSVPAEEETPSASRSTRKRGRRGRGASVTSSAVDSSVRGRTRSHSVASHNDAMSVDDNTTGQQVKPEPSTPGMSEDVMPGIEGSSAGAGRRTRGNTLQTTRPGKRKRDARDASETAGSEEVLGTPGPQQIVAPRYFSRMSVPLMNDITSHKYASLFSAPVKEKDAEGYKDMIRRPQDLKSIRAAVNVGAKAVAAAASVDTPSGNSPGGGGGNVLLPPSPEVMPPKAIVNSAQLERELMRMFANAVMFNSGEEGVVQDAREMFESVQQAVSNWRSAERTGDSEDVGPEEDNLMASKRRKV